MTTDAAYGIVATVKVRDDAVLAAKSVLESLVAGAQEESGVLDYTVIQSSADDSTFTIVERYVNSAAHDAHRQSPAFQEFQPQLIELLDGKPTSSHGTVIAGVKR
jgi:quinol monooxygenase YgiN